MHVPGTDRPQTELAGMHPMGFDDMDVSSILHR